MARNYVRDDSSLPHTQNRHSNSASAGKQNQNANDHIPEPLTPLQQAMLQEVDQTMRVRINGKDREVNASKAVLREL